MIRQREQEALARIKNNPVKMAVIRKSVEANKKNDESLEEEHQKLKSKHRKHSTSKYDSDSENDSHEETERKEKEKKKKKDHLDSDKDSRDRPRHHRHSHRDHEGEKQRHSSPSKHKSDRSQEDARDRERHNNRHSRRDYGSEDVERNKRSYEKAKHEDNPQDHQNDKYEYKARNNGSSRQVSDSNHSGLPPRPDSYKRRGRAPQLSEEERAARLREMQMDAEVHEEQRWKRLKKADEDDVREASHANNSNRGSSFLDSVQKSVYGAEKGGSSTIEESVRRRAHFLQGSREATERNAFRR